MGTISDVWYVLSNFDTHAKDRKFDRSEGAKVKHPRFYINNEYL